MRVTDRLVFDAAARDTARARERAEAAMQQASTGSRVERPGDDPAAAGLMQAFAMSSARLEAVSRAAGTAVTELQAADGALESMGNALVRAQELAVRLANAIHGAPERAAGAAEVAGLRAQLLAAANTRFGNRWIFGGARDGAQPFDPATGAYAGDAQLRQVEIAPGVLESASVRADVALGVGNVNGTVDVVDALNRLEAALTANDPGAVRATLGDLQTSVDQIAGARARAGVQMDSFRTATQAASVAAGDEKTRGDQLGEVDLVESSIRLSMAQRALEASLSASAQSFKLSLLTYL
jgi:flagellar hook-associated protein 3 FlgL